MSILQRPGAKVIPMSWGDIRDLPRPLPVVESLSETLLPAPLAGWLADVAERTQAPIEYAAAPALVALGALIGRAVGILPKRHDDWLVVPNLWGADIGRPGLMKSPLINEAMKPLRRLGQLASERFEREKATASAEADVLKIRVQSTQDEIKAALKKNGDVASLQSNLAVLKSKLETRCTERRYVTNDGTVEKIGELLNENPRGLLLLRDEISGFLRGLDRPGHEGDREFYLEAWNGTGQFTYDRIGRGTLHVDALTLSIFGSIQPAKLQGYVSRAIHNGVGDDGLLQRFQLMVWPDVAGEWQNIDRGPDHQAKNAAFHVYEAINALVPLTLPGIVEGGEIPALRFAPDAQELFDAWRARLESRLRSGDLEKSPAFESHLTKYRSLMPSLALIFHLVATVSGSSNEHGVSLEAARLAAGWCDFLELHARKVYAAELNGDVVAAHALDEKIRSGLVEDGVPVREIYRREWSSLRTSESVYAGLRLLQDSGRVQVERQEDGAGRPTELVWINPRVMGRVA